MLTKRHLIKREVNYAIVMDTIKPSIYTGATLVRVLVNGQSSIFKLTVTKDITCCTRTSHSKYITETATPPG